MSDFGDKARHHAQKLEYTEYSSREIAINKSKKAGDVLSENLEEYYLDELCDLLDIDSDNLDNPATQFKPYDIALATWSNWGAGSVGVATHRSSLSEGEFIVLNDYFTNITSLSDQ